MHEASFSSPKPIQMLFNEAHLQEYDRGDFGEGKSMDVCEHVEQLKDVNPSALGCEDCLKTGDGWVHLRICMECGHVGCCDNSKNRHATKHFHATDHPVVFSFEPGENWGWCYIDEIMFDTDRPYRQPTSRNEDRQHP